MTAYQSANGLVNLVTPTSAVVMGGLAIARVGYGTWLKFVWPVLILLAILTIVVLTVAVAPAMIDAARAVTDHRRADGRRAARTDAD